MDGCTCCCRVPLLSTTLFSFWRFGLYLAIWWSPRDVTVAIPELTAAVKTWYAARVFVTASAECSDSDMSAAAA